MDKLDMLARAGRVFFGLSLIAFGIQQFLYGDFVPGRAPAWPASMPGRLVWVAVSGLVLILCGAAIVASRKMRVAGVTVAVMIFLWAVLRHIPLAAADRIYGGAWANLGKALALTGGGPVARVDLRGASLPRCVPDLVRHPAFPVRPLRDVAGAHVDPRRTLLDLLRGSGPDRGRRRHHRSADDAPGLGAVRTDDLPVVRHAAHPARAGCSRGAEPERMDGGVRGPGHERDCLRARRRPS